MRIETGLRRWGDRLNQYNRHPFPPFDVTLIWDTTCFRVQKSRDWTFGRYTVNGRYDFPCLLVLTAVTFTGELVYASEFLRSTSYDAHSFIDTRHMHPQFRWERNLGDGHFACVPRFFTPIQKIGGRTLNAEEKDWNETLQLPRSRVKHINDVIKNHRLFKGEPYRGWIQNYALFVKIVNHDACDGRRAEKPWPIPRPTLRTIWPVEAQRRATLISMTRRRGCFMLVVYVSGEIGRAHV